MTAVGFSVSTRLHRAILVLGALLAPWTAAGAAELQTPVDRADPAVIGEEMRQSADQRSGAQPSPDRSVIGVPGPASGPSSSGGFIAGAIRIVGAEMLSPTDFAAAIEPYLGRELDGEALRALARDVADVARRAGYGLATAAVPPQDVLNGILRVQLDEGRIDAIEVSGPAAAMVERRLAPLADGRPVRTAELERRLRIAGDLAGVAVGQARLARRGARNILILDTGFDRVSAQAWIDNWGSDTVGPVRLRLSADVNRLLAGGDRLSFGGVVTPLQPGEFQLAHARYALPVGTAGTELAVRGYVGHTEAGAALKSLDLDGISYELAVSASHPLIRSREASLWGTIDFSMRDSELSRRDLRLRNDRVAAASFSLYGTAAAAGGQARVRLTLVQGLDLLGATDRGDPLASRFNAGGTFTKFAFWTEYYRSLGGRFSLLLRGEGQIASRPLLSSEEMGLGGNPFLRGYDYRERAGDRGAAAVGELRFDLRNLPSPLRRAQLYVYGDAGRVVNQRGGFGDGSLVSAGGGVRFWARHGIEGAAEIGVPLADGFNGRRPGPRFTFILGARF
ncbi:ShlB/FhaC/HecB family hemolysin secretion/activation protein [Sphingosinicella terrae]|uniref:ShlB/FhaC/HecB family hemolysin secretion/activation protein n=1 Tax=Sphingosinicella terrae TaxID=2172047 RepID=UPI000E0D1B1C|nr:ShlB/FhaC/HecB family hemolysin secretion/activation protein [Sphingosinicella terrae]